jgi:hypothetical protein
MKQRFLITCTLTMMTLMAFAQKPLTLNLKVGDKWYYEYTQKEGFGPAGGSMDFLSSNTLGIVYEVLKADGSTYDIKATFDRIQFNSTSPMEEILFDSEKKEDLEGEMGVGARKMLGNYFVFTIDAKSRKLIAVKESPKKVQLSQPRGPEPNVRLFPQTDEQITKAVAKLFGGNIKESAPVTGASWDVSEKVELIPGLTEVKRTSYKISSIGQDKITINEDVKITLERESKEAGTFNGTGTAVVDAITGLLTESKFESKGTQVMNSPMGEQTMSRSTEVLITVRKQK